MRCVFCSSQLSREKPGVAGPGVVLCYDCIALANDIAQGRLPMTSASDRPAWGLALMDADAMAFLDDETLRAELRVTTEIAQPLNDFIAAAQARLDGKPDWRPVSSSHHHRHDEAVTFPNGTTVVARSFAGPSSYARKPFPDFGWYFDPVWSPPWPHEHLVWPDFGVPQDVTAFVVGCQSVVARMARGEEVEIGCLGGHGRTGTALAVLAALCGVAQADAVSWVRSNYCERAVETEEQSQFVLSVRLV
jgi:ClpX C4-type zinc finger/Protein-tyrosine phosphatase